IYKLVGAALAPARDQSVEQLAAEVASGELGRTVGRLVDRAAVDGGLARVLDDLLATEILVGLNAVRAVDGSPLVRALDVEIVAVADVYVALSGGRGYRRALPPDQVVKALWRLGGGHLNRQLVAQLIAMLPTYPLGASVIVQSGRYHGYRGLVCRVRRQ